MVSGLADAAVGRPEHAERLTPMITVDDMLPDDDVRCTAGQAVKPTRDTCHRHRDHSWCKTCEGWYGVPHDGGMHARGRGHDGRGWTPGCACRPCREVAASIEARR